MEERPYLILSKRLCRIDLECALLCPRDYDEYFDWKYNDEISTKYNLATLNVHKFEFYPSFVRLFHQEGTVDLNLKCEIIGSQDDFKKSISKYKASDQVYCGFKCWIQKDEIEIFESTERYHGHYLGFRDYVYNMIVKLKEFGFEDITLK